MLSNDFNDSSPYPKKLIRQLRRQVAMSHSPQQIFTEPNSLADQFEDFYLQLNSFYKEHCKLATNSLTTPETWKKFDSKLQQHMDRFEECINDVIHSLLEEFENLHIFEDQIVSTRRRIEREREIRDHNRQAAEMDSLKWGEISLTSYVPAFLRWLVNSWDPVKTDWAWLSEDWESDIEYAMRGYFLAKNKQDGSGYDIFGIQTIEEAKALAEPHIPREGIDIFINAFDAAGYDRSTLPEPWQGDARFTIDLPNMHATNPEFEVMATDNDYLIIHIKNMDAAIAFGYETSWCTAQQPNSDDGNYFDDYSDTLIITCDKDGRRFQIHLGRDQCHNEADNDIDWMDLCDRYDKLFPTLITIQSDAAHDDIKEHVRLSMQGNVIEKSYYDIQKDALKKFASARLGHAIECGDTEQLCQLFNAVSAIDIQDIRDDIWLSFPKKSLQQAIEIIPDVELSIEYFVDEYWRIGERGRDYLAGGGLLTQYQEWLISQKQGPLPKSITNALKIG